ncbi:Ropporin-1-like protein [Saguinus oedipus]|uniref:Ropporin-1-like protein n=1 Tax=Saguinus oedipus TaxID=9490 RepID=A0ABQ9W894_SAGOE|nr:Ropporin-1-like protein [Saguinus oedipus]
MQAVGCQPCPMQAASVAGGRVHSTPGHLPEWSLNTALKHLCEILTDDPEGGPARIPFETFSYVYRYLAKLDSDMSFSETESYLASLKENM